MLKITLLILAFSVNAFAESRIPDFEYGIAKKGAKYEYFYFGKKIDFKTLKENLKKIFKELGSNTPINLRLGSNVPFSEVSKHLNFFKEIKVKKINILVFDEDDNFYKIPVELNEIEIEKKVEIQEPPPSN